MSVEPVKILRIVDPSRFAVSQNKAHVDPKWWACPTTMSRKCRRLVGASKHGLEHYGVWCLLVSYMATRRFQWTLTGSDGKPVPLSEVAWEWRVGEASIEHAVKALIELGWLEWSEAPPSPEAAPREAGDTDGQDEQNGRDEHDGRWRLLAVRLGVGVAGTGCFSTAIASGVPAARVYAALKDQLDSGKPVRKPDAWARTVAAGLTEEKLG